MIVRKCRLYADYYQSGTEQAKRGESFPASCWAVPDELRAERLRGDSAGASATGRAIRCNDERPGGGRAQFTQIDNS